jgi:hypothetical protein
VHRECTRSAQCCRRGDLRGSRQPSVSVVRVALVEEWMA